jgi:uncharacterized protein YfaA (DUF2138 family)
VNDFLKELKRALRAEPFCDNQRALALHSGIDGAQLFRIVGGEREPTPEFVGRLCGTLPAETAARLLTAFLQDIVCATAKAKPGPLPKGDEKKRRGTWHPPLTNLSLRINCEPQLEKTGSD